LGQQRAIGDFQGRKRIEHTVRSWKWPIVFWWPDMDRAKRFWTKYLCNVGVKWTRFTICKTKKVACYRRLL